MEVPEVRTLSGGKEDVINGERRDDVFVRGHNKLKLYFESERVVSE